jgi:hypothetical protein
LFDIAVFTFFVQESDETEFLVMQYQEGLFNNPDEERSTGHCWSNNWQEKSEMLVTQTAPLSLCPKQNSHGLSVTEPVDWLTACQKAAE